MTLKLDKETLEKLRNGLKKGDMTRIAKSIGVDPNYVSMVLRGVSNNEQVVDMAIKIARERKENLEARVKIINEL